MVRPAAGRAPTIGARMEILSWFIGHVIGRIVLPPTIFFLLIAFGLWHRHKKWGVWLTGSSLALLWLLSTPLVAYSLWGSMTETAVPIAVAQVADLPKQGTIIVILSAGKRSALEYPSGETAVTVNRAAGTLRCLGCKGKRTTPRDSWRQALGAMERSRVDSQLRRNRAQTSSDAYRRSRPGHPGGGHKPGRAAAQR